MANWQSWAPLPWSAWPQVLTAVLAVPHTPGTGQVPRGATGLTSGTHEPACWRELHDWSCHPKRVSTSILGPAGLYHPVLCQGRPGWLSLVWFWIGRIDGQAWCGSGMGKRVARAGMGVGLLLPPPLGTDPPTGEHCDLGIGQPGHSALRPAPLLVPAAPPQMHP